ncbi:MAG: YopX family protein [Alistipes sp.]
MREIKFRGKRLDNGKWIIGDLLRMGGCTFIFPDPAPDSFDRYMVDPSTVGQFTGLLDKNGKEIWEGDVALNIYNRVVICEWFRGGFWLNGAQHGADYNIHLVYKDIEIIGNIHDNPELVK